MRLKLLGVVAASGFILLSACSSDTDADNETTSSADTAALLEEARAEVEAARAIPAVDELGPSIDVPSIEGSLIYSIPIDANNEFYATGEETMREVAADAGVELITFPADGTQTSFQQGFQQALNAGADAILLNGPVPETLEPQIDDALAAGVPVVPLHVTDAGEPARDNMPYEAFAPFNQGARLAALAAVVDADGQEPINALIMEVAETNPSDGMVETMTEVIEEYGVEGSKVTVVNSPVVEWATLIQGQVQSELLRDPEINTILPIYDSMSTFIVPAIEQSAPDREIGIYSFNGSPAILDMVREGQVQADAAENPNWVAYVNVDTAFRAILGVDPIEGATGPLRLIDSTNVEETGVPSEVGKGFGDEYEDAFRQMWGIDG